MFTPGQPVFLEALGWALLNSVWYFGLLWICFTVLLLIKPALSSANRHWLALGLLFTGFAGFVISLYAHFFNPGGYLLKQLSLSSGKYDVPYYFTRETIQQTLSSLSMLYLLMVVVLFIRFCRFYYHSHKALNEGLTMIPEAIDMQVKELVQKLDIRRKVSVWVSELVDTPMIIGFIKPVILLPVACLNQLPVSQMEAILLHELSHIKRNDYLVNLFVSGCEIIFFFNPFTWLFINTIRRERENACDDQVITLQNDPFQYATALMTLEKSRAGLLTVGLAATGKNKHMLLNRIQRILKLKPAEKNKFSPQVLATFITIAFLSFVTFVIPDETPGGKLQRKVIRQDKIQVQDIVKTRTYTHSADVIIETVTVPGSPLPPPEPAFPVNTPDSLFEPGIKITPAGYNEAPAQRNLAIYEEQRDFTIPEVIDPLLPATVMIPNNYPYVPSSSFSFYKIDDSVKNEIIQKYVMEKVILENALQVKKLSEQLSVMFPEMPSAELQDILKTDSLMDEQQVIMLQKQVENKKEIRKKNTKDPRIITRKKTVIVYI